MILKTALDIKLPKDDRVTDKKKKDIIILTKTLLKFVRETINSLTL